MENSVAFYARFIDARVYDHVEKYHEKGFRLSCFENPVATTASAVVSLSVRVRS